MKLMVFKKKVFIRLEQGIFNAIEPVEKKMVGLWVLNHLLRIVSANYFDLSLPRIER